MEKAKKFPKWLIILLLVVSGVALLIGGLLLFYQIQCNDITGTERRVMKICAEEDSELRNLRYANYLKTENNGYRDYSYYDVETTNGRHYIIEIREGTSSMEFISKRSYAGVLYRYIFLDDLVKYRSSEAGSFIDRTEDAMDALRELY